MNQRILLGSIALFGCAMGSAGVAAAPHGPASELARIRLQLAALPVPFVPNAGQWDPQAAFAARTLAGTLFVTTDGRLVCSLPGVPAAEQPGDRATAAHAARPADHPRTSAGAPGWVLTETFVDAARQPIHVTPSGGRPVAARVSYFLGGDPRQHRRGLETFERISLGEVFPGIAVQLRATGSNVEKIFTVAAGRDPTRIRLRIDGTTRLELGPQGELIAHTGNGPLTYTAPIAFQEDSAGTRSAVPVRYALAADDATYGFVPGDYDRTRPLVIDPLLQSTYLGAGGQEWAAAVAIHPVTGDVYVTGQTASSGSTFPGVIGGAQQSLAPGIDAFVSRFSADLATLIQSSYLGGPLADYGYALAIHPVSGDVYVAGQTNSTAFPGVAGGAQAVYGGGTYDGFVSRFNASLTTLIQSTYLGAAGGEAAIAVAVHPLSGDVYVAGSTSSPAATFPGVSGGAQGSSGGGSDAFVSRFSADLATLVVSTYLGAAGDESGRALAIDPASGDVLVAGQTGSVTPAFPGVSGAAQASHGGGTYDAFVSRLTADLSTLVRSSYLGAAGDDYGRALAIDPIRGDVYLAGDTNSSTTTFPGVDGGAQGSSGGVVDAFVSRFNADLTRLTRSSYLGAGGTDQAFALAIAPVSGDIYVAGLTTSPGATFPGVNGGAQSSHGGGTNDAFVSRFLADLTSLTQSTYLGAGGNEYASGLAIAPVSGNIYVAGFTSSTAATFPGVSGGAQGSYGGGAVDAFVSRFTLDLEAADVVPDAFAFAAQSGVPMSVLRTSAPVPITGLGTSATVSVSGALGSAACVSTTSGCTCDATPLGTFSTMPVAVVNNQYLCIRHVSAPVPNALRETFVTVGGAATKFQTYTGTNLSPCTLDVDGNGLNDALTDGLIIIRALFGLTGTAVTNGAIGPGATRASWAQLRPWLNGNCGTSFAP